MIFEEVIGIKIRPIESKIQIREAVRAIVVRGNQILMIHNNKGDYKFPGGGVEAGEDHNTALEREVLEETGYTISGIRDKVGIVTERREDICEENMIFEMNSHYYLCEISGLQQEQNLDDYEAKLDFMVHWMTIDDVIRKNEQVLKNNEDKNPWVVRELYVLNELKEHYF